MKNKTSIVMLVLSFFHTLLVVPAVRLFGLKGSWKWAVKEMKKGEMIVRSNVSGTLKYRLSHDDQDMLEWDFHRKETDVEWESANFFISDMMATDWIIFNWR